MCYYGECHNLMQRTTCAHRTIFPSVRASTTTHREYKTTTKSIMPIFFCRRVASTLHMYTRRRRRRSDSTTNRDPDDEDKLVLVRSSSPPSINDEAPAACHKIRSIVGKDEWQTKPPPPSPLPLPPPSVRKMHFRCRHALNLKRIIAIHSSTTVSTTHHCTALHAPTMGEHHTDPNSIMCAYSRAEFQWEALSLTLPLEQETSTILPTV